MRAFQQTVFQNLIENAIRYRAADPPRIQISAVMRDKEWLFKVRDNGIGIPREFHQQIWRLQAASYSQRVSGHWHGC